MSSRVSTPADDAEALEPEVMPASDPLLTDPSVLIGASSDRGVGVGLGATLGTNVRIGVGLGL